ncbi:MAG: EAL domain-containing protein [Oscillospiraceae bacterium]
MKVYNHLYQNKKKFDFFLNGIGIDRSKQAMIRIHSSVHSAKEMNSLTAEIGEFLPNAKIIGCSTPGVILDGKIISDSCLVSITTFEKCEVESVFIDSIKNEKYLCAELSEKLIKGRSGFLLIFLPAGFTKGIMLVNLINKKNPGVKMLGGAAGYKTKKSRSYVIEGGNVSEKAVSAAFISSDSLFAYENFICGADCSGKGCIVKKVRKCNIERIDEKNGAEWYSEFIDKTELENDPELSVLFPIIRETDVQIPYLSKFEHKKEERLELSCELPRDSVIYSGYFNPQKMLDEMRTVYHELKQAPLEILFAYDCQSRMIVMHRCAKWETEQFTATNISGALLSGEIVWRGKKNYFANFTFAIACLSENENTHIPLRSRDFSDTFAIRQNNIKAVNYLLASGNRQLNKQLENQQNKIKNSLLRNEALGLDNQFCYLSERENIHLNKIALYVLNNEKMVKLFVGRRAIFEELKRIYCNVSKRLNERGILHIYSYETSSLLISADDSISRSDFEIIAEDILKYLNNITLSEVQLSYRCAVVEDEKEPLHKVETALQYGLDYNIPFVRYEQIADSIMDKTEEIHILQVIRDALAEERIVPYFQGIYDNNEKRFGLYESLMRISDKNGKIYFPNQFLPVAKKYNLYELMSIIMVKNVMQMFVDSDVKVTINLNVRDIYDREMIKLIFEYLDKAAHPENFIFELVESEEITDYQYIKEFADRIHEKKAMIAIDDFGNGFSNLMHIIRIDADFLKIDGEIIRSVCDDEKCMQFVEIIASWCNNHQKQVIAEFVENEKIQRIIEKIGITYSQGYYFSKPQPWESVKSK